ncbi:CheR family methyltransferase [Sphingobacterium deserti]|uniref:protein-glutamate O-methyltransferase n=1 Tax=Sphingobacterium deserti TaxID=1229276 RepID=A0A0B8T687_9SPHI|nr:CheR family methyltransferase [Sphingobacterium deserti]KGE12600.1 MCP methyltransferase/methylesterase CheR/CheB [Sphingobacterium deserti]
MMKNKVQEENSIKSENAINETIRATERFSVVGLGAGVGSLTALEQFFRHMPTNPSIAFVIIAHNLDLTLSAYQERVQSFSPMPVELATDGQELEPNKIYLTPSDKEVGMHQKRFLFFEPTRDKGACMVIDQFFECLAEDQGAMGVGIVLSGIGADGETGVRMIKEKLGMTMAQQPETAEFPSMPTAAIRTQLIDYVLPPEQMPAKLVQYLLHPSIHTLQGNMEDNMDNDIHIQKILMLLRASTGHDFTLYKKNTISRRIERRIAFHQLAGYDSYVHFLREHPAELDTLFNELLINVTKFFRDRHGFEILKRHLYQLLESKDPDEPIRIWIAGCSTGEEAYSVAILVTEYLENAAMQPRNRPQIFATDLDAQAIDQARDGFYFSNIASELSPQQLDRFFIERNNGYVVKKEIREMIVFAQHNLVKDAPFTRLDLLCCRNVMIYLTAELQKKIIPIFHYSLNGSGLLYLGPAESINGYQDIFDIVDSKWKIFRRKNGIAAVGKFLDFPFHVGTQGKQFKSDLSMPQTAKNPVAEHFNKMLLQQHTPAAFLLNEKGEILYVNGKTNRYVELHPGEAVMNIHRMIREELKYVLSNAFHQAQRQKTTVAVQDIKIKEGSRTLAVGFTVTYIDESPLQGMILVTFREKDLPKRTGKPKQNGTVSTAAVEELEKELTYTKQQLHTTIEQMETSLEELKSTNEELQSTNEELQSTNEEALTTKEEMQSLNEELMTINHQYQTKAEELTQLNNDMKNLLDNIEIGTIFLDNKLSILRFTPQITRLFNVIPSDVGRSITHIVSNFDYPAIENKITDVIDTLIGKELEVKTKKNEWYNLRIMPYRTMDNFISGAVLTFTKTTPVKALHTQLSGLLSYTLASIRHESDAVAILDADYKLIINNNAFLQLFNLTILELNEHSLLDIVHNKWQMTEFADGLKTADLHMQMKIQHHINGVGWLDLTATIDKIPNDENKIEAIKLTLIRHN